MGRKTTILKITQRIGKPVQVGDLAKLLLNIKLEKMKLNFKNMSFAELGALRKVLVTNMDWWDGVAKRETIEEEKKMQLKQAYAIHQTIEKLDSVTYTRMWKHVKFYQT